MGNGYDFRDYISYNRYYIWWCFGNYGEDEIMEINKLKKLAETKVVEYGDELIEEVKSILELRKAGDDDCFDYEELATKYTAFIGVLSTLATCEVIEDM